MTSWVVIRYDALECEVLISNVEAKLPDEIKSPEFKALSRLNREKVLL